MGLTCCTTCCAARERQCTEMIDGEGSVQDILINSTGTCIRESRDSPCFST